MLPSIWGSYLVLKICFFVRIAGPPVVALPWLLYTIPFYSIPTLYHSSIPFLYTILYDTILYDTLYQYHPLYLPYTYPIPFLYTYSIPFYTILYTNTIPLYLLYTITSIPFYTILYHYSKPSF